MTDQERYQLTHELYMLSTMRFQAELVAKLALNKPTSQPDIPVSDQTTSEQTAGTS